MSDLSAAFDLLDNFDAWLDHARATSAPDADLGVMFLRALDETGALDDLPGCDDPVPADLSPILANGQFRVGPYTLADGRQFVGLNEFELRDFCREGWRKQHVADIRLAMRLDATRKSVPLVGPGAGKPLFRTGDLFSGGDLSPRTDAERGSEDGPFRATPAPHGRM